MTSDQKTPELNQSDENSSNVDFNETNWNCITSQAFLKCYLKYSIPVEKDADRVVTLDESKQDGKRPLTKPSTSSDAKRMKLDSGYPSTGKCQLTTITKTNNWHTKLCKCDECLKMYEKYNIEFLFGIKNIEWLPTEILIKIFTLLVSSDRRVTSECCKRLLEIWLCDDFIDDRRLVFDNCVLDPAREPLSTFWKSQRNYHILVFGDVFMKEESDFPTSLTETVTTIEFNENFGCQNVNITPFLLPFTNLKRITVADHRQLGDFPDLPKTVVLLVVANDKRPVDEYDNDNHDNIRFCLDKTSDAFRIELKCRIRANDILSFTEYQRNKIQGLRLYLERGDNTLKLPRFVNLKYLIIRISLTCVYGTERLLENIEEQLPALEDLSIAVWEILPHQNWNCLKTLHMQFLDRHFVRSRLTSFENLKEQSLEFANGCFFVHEAFLNKNLKTLKINCTHPCITCFQTMTKSYPKLETLICSFYVTNDYLNKLATNSPKLKCLTIREFDSSLSLACLPNLTELKIEKGCRLHMMQTWPLMLRLRKLNIHLFQLTPKSVKIFERMPALEYLTLRCGPIYGDQVMIFEALTKPLKRLKQIWFNCRRVRRKKYPIIIDVMVNNCKYLQDITFYNSETEESYASEKVLEQLLQKHSSIRCIDSTWLGQDLQ